MYTRKIAIYFLLLLGFCLSGSAQSEKPFANVKDWEFVSTDHFDVYYFGNNKSGAIRTAKFAELARYELGILFDYKPESRFILMYAADPQEIIHTNIETAPREKIPTVLNLPKLTGIVVHPGTTRGLYQEVKRNVARLILKEFAYGDRLGNTIQAELLLYNSIWFTEGLADYVASGWTFEDEMWVNTINGDDLLELALEGDAHINRVVRKSIWQFITHEYGEQKISEIIYLVNISHSIESGIISVLGIQLGTLTERWREFIRSGASTQAKGRLRMDQFPEDTSIPVKDGHKLVSFAYNEAKNLFALFLDKNGQQSVYLYDAESGEMTKTPVKSSQANPHATFYQFDLPMAWSSDGNRLVTTVYHRKSSKLAWYDVANDKVTYTTVPSNLRKIAHLSWSVDGKRVAVSALNKGKMDIYLTKSGESAFEPLTSDPFDNVDPSFSFDGQYLFFSSNRDTLDPGNHWKSYEHNFDLYRYDLTEAGGDIVRITETPSINERQPYPVSSFELMYISDESGIHNAKKTNIFTGEVSPVTNFELGIERFQATDKHISFTTTPQGIRTVYHLSSNQIVTPGDPEPTLLRLDYESNFLARVKAEQERVEMQSPATDEEPLPSEENVSEQAQPTETADSLAIIEEDSKQPVRYYIFDEEDQPYVEIKPSNKVFSFQEESKTIKTVFGDLPKPDLEDIEVGASQRAKTMWSADYIGLGLTYDPLARIGLDFNVGISDLMKNHEITASIRPFINLKNTFADVRYTYKKHRVDLFAHVGYMARTLRESSPIPNDSMLFRFDQLSLNLGARYPLTAYATAEISAGIFHIDRKDQQIQHQILLNDEDKVLHAGAAIDFDNVKEREGYAYKGVKARASFDSYYSTQKADFIFHRAQAEARNYVEVYKNIVLASRISTAFNFPKSQRQFYMGGVDDQMLLIEFQNKEGQAVRNNTIDTSLHSFHFQQFIMPIRGFRPITREGSRYVLANFELRIPISRLLKTTLNSTALYKLELIPFVDAGTVWVDGNPISKKKPTDTQFISNGAVSVRLQTLKSPFLVGFGTGLRTNLLGYSVRTDIAWGIDDSTLQSPILLISIGKNF